MARIAGVDLPRNKHIDIALTYIYGIGHPRAERIVTAANVDRAKKVQDLMGSLKLPDLVERLQKLPGQVDKGKLQDAKVTAADGAERTSTTV